MFRAHRELSNECGFIKIQAIFCKLGFRGMLASWRWLSAPPGSEHVSVACENVLVACENVRVAYLRVSVAYLRVSAPYLKVDLRC